MINTVAPNLPLQLQGEDASAARDRAAGEASGHRGLSLGDLHVQEALRVALGGEATVLARAAEARCWSPSNEASCALLFIGFDLMASDLPLRVAFPVLFHNALEWFQPERRGVSRSTARRRARR